MGAENIRAVQAQCNAYQQANQGNIAVYSILDEALLAGNLPTNKHKLVVAWIEIQSSSLLIQSGHPSYLPLFGLVSGVQITVNLHTLRWLLFDNDRRMAA